MHAGKQLELQPIIEFLQENIPFNALPEGELQSIATAIEIQYFRKGHVFFNGGGTVDHGGLRMIRSGAAELRGAEEQLIERIEEGESFNFKGLQSEYKDVRATLIEDTLLYFINEDFYQSLRDRYREIDRFFHSQRNRRIRRAARYEPIPNDMLRQVSDIMARDVLSVPPSYSIQQTATIMSERSISSVLILSAGNLRGIVTDRDMRSRAVASGIDCSRPVGEIMTASPDCIKESASLFDATLFMTEHGYHHVPVVADESAEDSTDDEQRVVGIITASDLMLARQDDPVFIVQHIRREKSIAGIQKITQQLPNLLVQWRQAGMRAYQISRILTAVSDAVTRRLITLAVEELGEPPVAFCWLGFGSQGRGEQLLGADQDNGLLISDELKEEDKPWFETLATRVCDGLNECGYVYCNGGIMATTDEWCQPLKRWRKTVDRWTQTPTADAVMRVSIFFDLRSIYGAESLCDQLQAHMLKRTGENSIFIAALAENVLDAPPPLGIFRHFVVEHNGDHRDALNLKKRAVLPIVDSARIHALANGISAVNTYERLQALAEKGVMSKGQSRNLQDAWSVIMQVRVEAQAQQIVNADEVSNYLNPDDLSKLEKKQLRDAFKVVGDAQSIVRMRYRPGVG